MFNKYEVSYSLSIYSVEGKQRSKFPSKLIFFINALPKIITKQAEKLALPYYKRFRPDPKTECQSASQWAKRVFIVACQRLSFGCLFTAPIVVAIVVASCCCSGCQFVAKSGRNAIFISAKRICSFQVGTTLAIF